MRRELKQWFDSVAARALIPFLIEEARVAILAANAADELADGPATSETAHSSG
jgi:hypothetical protein